MIDSGLEIKKILQEDGIVIPSSLDCSLKSLGVTSILFLKIIIHLCSVYNVKIENVDPQKVTLNTDLIDIDNYFKNINK